MSDARFSNVECSTRSSCYHHQHLPVNRTLPREPQRLDRLADEAMVRGPQIAAQMGARLPETPMNQVVIWCVTALLCPGIGSSYLLDGPTEFDAAVATAAAARDAERFAAATPEPQP